MLIESCGLTWNLTWLVVQQQATLNTVIWLATLKFLHRTHKKDNYCSLCVIINSTLGLTIQSISVSPLTCRLELWNLGPHLRRTLLCITTTPSHLKTQPWQWWTLSRKTLISFLLASLWKRPLAPRMLETRAKEELHLAKKSSQGEFRSCVTFVLASFPGSGRGRAWEWGYFVHLFQGRLH